MTTKACSLNAVSFGAKFPSPIPCINPDFSTFAAQLTDQGLMSGMSFTDTSKKAILAKIHMKHEFYKLWPFLYTKLEPL